MKYTTSVGCVFLLDIVSVVFVGVNSFMQFFTGWSTNVFKNFLLNSVYLIIANSLFKESFVDAKLKVIYILEEVKKN